jgi:hypothetical protein
MLVTAKHVFFKGKRAVAPFGSCSFRSYSRRKAAIPVLVEQDQRKGYVFNNEDFVVVRLKRALEGCSAFTINDSDSSLREEEELLSVTGRQLGTLNNLSNREPVVAKGKIKRVLSVVPRPAAIARRSPKDWNWPHRREQNQDPCNGNDCNKTIG